MNEREIREIFEYASNYLDYGEMDQLADAIKNNDLATISYYLHKIMDVCDDEDTRKKLVKTMRR